MHDQFNNPVSCTSTAALRAYDRAVDAHLHAWPGLLEAVQTAIDEAPDFALAHGLQALVLAGRGRGPEARTALGRATALAHSHPRETSQLALVAAVVQGRVADALAALLEHSRRYPTDALAASTGMGAYGLFAFSGRADHDTARLAFIETLLPHYPAEFPWLLANQGWGHIELGRVQEGMAMAQRAIALRPANGHNAHILMHGFYEGRQPEAALDFLARWLPSYPDDALMWGHLQWHAALVHVALGRSDEAVRLLLGPIRDYLPRGTPFMGLADTASLLWRLGLLGVKGIPWDLARQHADRYFPQGGNVFAELHLAMLSAAQRNLPALRDAEQRLYTIADAGHAGALVAAQWVQGLQALLHGDGAAAQAHMNACCEGAVRVGGSNAQRSVISQTRQALSVPAM